VQSQRHGGDLGTGLGDDAHRGEREPGLGDHTSRVDLGEREHAVAREREERAEVLPAARMRLVHDRLGTGLVQGQRHREPADTTTDDQNPRHPAQ
jgi:hypothetical protein